MAAARSTSARTPISDQADAKLAGYPGSKGASGLAERIIREMPPHATYIEAFAGHAAVFRKKRPAATSLLIDIDAKVCHRLRSYLAGRDGARAEVRHIRR